MTLAAEALVEIDVNRDVIVECTCPNETSAALGARLLMNQGCHKPRAPAGGLAAKVGAGFSVVY
jgi:rhodanese-related sulfurtransferase